MTEADTDGAPLLVVVERPRDADEAAALCGRLKAQLEATDAEVAVCDVAALVDPDLTTVDALARVLLTARRLGRSVHLRNPPGELLELLALTGLDDLAPWTIDDP